MHEPCLAGSPESSEAPGPLCDHLALEGVGMARGFAAEVWEGDGKFLQQMSRKCGQHCTH